MLIELTSNIVISIPMINFTNFNAHSEMMKRLIFFLFFIPFIINAQTPKKLIGEGAYDQAIDILVPALEKNSKSRKNMSLLEEAFIKANKQDQDSLLEFKLSGMPDIWSDVYRLYQRLDRRQMEIRMLPANVTQSLDYDWVDYTMDLEATKSRAASYYYAHARRLLEKGGRENARIAYKELWRITRLYKSYKDVDGLLRFALVKDCGTLPVKVINRTGNKLPPYLPPAATDISLTLIEKAYLDYTLKPINGWIYEYTICIYIDRVKLTPDQTDKEKYIRSKKVPLTANDTGQGNFTKVSCEITEITQKKAAEISGFLGFIDNRSGKVIYQTPIRSKALFKAAYYYVQGDFRACPPEVLEKVDTSIEPFPSEESMVRNAAHKLGIMVKNIIWDEDFIYY